MCVCVCLFTGTRQPITSANVGAVTSGDGNEISYSLFRLPRLGRLILANDRNQYEEISQFSQSQVIAFSAGAAKYAFLAYVSFRRHLTRFPFCLSEVVNDFMLAGRYRST